jgi:alpha-N-acetylglucosamine transferase
MDLALEPDMYSPSIDEAGNYVDRIPPIRHGIYCVCGSRKDKLYDTTAKFRTHIGTKIHQKWLTDLNTNRANYYVENIRLEDTIKQQRLLIAQMEKEINTKSKTIDLLTERLIQPQKPPIDLIDWN